MDISQATCLSEMGMEDLALVYHCQMMNSLDDSFHDEFGNSLSSETFSANPPFYLQSSPPIDEIEIVNKPAAKQLKTNNYWNYSYGTEKSTPKAAPYSSSNLISFGNSNTGPDSFSYNLYGNPNSTMKTKNEAMSHKNINFSHIYETPDDAFGEETPRVCAAARTRLQAKDHVLAERKRRERLTKRFIALSALLPGLKKLDKASVLGDAVKHIKQLQEQVKKLEEEEGKKPEESLVCVKKSWVSGDDVTSSSSDENFDISSGQLCPEIEVRVSDKNVLVRIHCEEHVGFISKVFSEIEKSHLIVFNSSVMPFGHSTLVITIVAQMDNQFSMTANDLSRSLRLALQN